MQLFLVDYCTAMGIYDESGDIIICKASKEPTFDQVARAIESPATGTVYVEGLKRVYEKDIRKMKVELTVEVKN